MLSQHAVRTPICRPRCTSKWVVVRCWGVRYSCWYVHRGYRLSMRDIIIRQSIRHQQPGRQHPGKGYPAVSVGIPPLGSARCLPCPMFPSPYVPRFMILFPMFPMFPSPYVVTQKCFPVPLLPKLILPSPCVPQYPCFPYSPVPYVSQSICSPVPVLPSPFVSSPYRCSPVRMLPVPMFPQLIHQSPCSPHLFHKRVSHSLYSPNMFPSTYVPQCLCSPNLFPSPYVPPTSLPVPMYVPQSYSTEVFSIPYKYSPNMFPSAYVPQSLCSGSN